MGPAEASAPAIAQKDAYDAPLDSTALLSALIASRSRSPRLPGMFFNKLPHGRGPDECWPWQGSIDTSGYARYGDGRYGTVYAHLLLWRVMRGDVPEGMEVDHVCFNRACMNPGHHRLLTVAENRQHHDPARLATHCLKGHPRSGDNLYVNPKTGRRSCRECGRLANQAWLAKGDNRERQNALRNQRRAS